MLALVFFSSAQGAGALARISSANAQFLGCETPEPIAATTAVVVEAPES